METITLRRDKELFKKQVIGSLVFVIGSAIALQLIINLLLFWAPTTERVLTILVWLLVPVFCLVAYVGLWSDWRSRYYEISDESITVYKKMGFLGNTAAVYRYESIVSMRKEQSYWGKKWNYGDIRVTIPKLDKQVVLRHVSDPSKVLAEIQKRLHQNSGGRTHSLIT